MTQALDALLIAFGLLTAICGVLRGASFSKADRKKHPILKKLDGKKVILFTPIQSSFHDITSTLPCPLTLVVAAK
ncbi:MAG: hypothetical protein O6943_02165 [Bacteroidetes bacterium]|nr:hypothetical protein [Bacteroidota bacterium]